MKMEAEVRGALQKRQESRRIDREVTEHYVVARETHDAQLAKKEFKKASDVGDYMESKRALWWRHDSTQAIEIAYIRQLAGDLGGGYLLQQATDMLPDGKSKMEIDKAVVALRILCTSKA